MNTKNIFCLVANSGSGKTLYLDFLMQDKSFVKKANLSRLVYSTTRSKQKLEVDNIYYHFKTNEEYEAIPENEIIEFRSYYDNGTVYYFTEAKDILDKNSNLICIASPYQYESYVRWAANQNIIKPNSYSVNMIYVDTRLRTIASNLVKYNNTADDQDIIDFCRRTIQEIAELEDARNRIPELMEPTLCSNLCYIDNNMFENDAVKVNLEKIKIFILKMINKHQINV